MYWKAERQEQSTEVRGHHGEDITRQSTDTTIACRFIDVLVHDDIYSYTCKYILSNEKKNRIYKRPLSAFRFFQGTQRYVSHVRYTSQRSRHTVVT